MKIEKGIPIPNRKDAQSGKWKDLLLQMEIGDSIGGLTNNEKQSALNAFKRLGLRGTSIHEGGHFYRIWRTQ